MRGAPLFLPSGMTWSCGSTLKGVCSALTELVSMVKQDLEARFANVGIMRHLYIMDPMWEGNTRQALLEWEAHFATAPGQLESQFADMIVAKRVYVASNPASINAAAHEFWPPLLSAQQTSLPDLCRCMGALVSLSWQNASVERDLAIVKNVRDVACGSLQHERLDSRSRVVVEGVADEKVRGERLTGIVEAVAREWCSRQRRRQSPAAPAKCGPQGDVPLRGKRHGPGALEQVVQAEAAHLQALDGEVDEVDIAALLFSV